MNILFSIYSRHFLRSISHTDREQSCCRPGLASFLLASLFIFSQPVEAGESSANNPSNLVGHGGPVNCISVSPDGNSALTGSLDYTVMFWDIHTQKPKLNQRFVKHYGAVSAVEFMPSGSQALSGGDDAMVYLWHLESRKLLHQFKGHESKIVALSVSEDGNTAASASWDGTVRVWDIKARQPGPVIRVHKEPVNSVLISADGKIVYAGSYDGGIREWNASTGELKRILYNHGWPVNIMRWLPDGQHIVFGTANGDVQVLDTNEGKVTKILIPHEKPVLGLAVSEKHGLIGTGSSDGVIRVWNIEDWSVVGENYNVNGPAWSLAFSGDGKQLYYAGLDDQVAAWKISQEEKREQNRTPRRFQVQAGASPGELQFARKCSVCHTLSPDGANRAGPSLYGVFGRKAGTLPGYHYSEGLRRADVIWNEKTIDQLFVKGPQAVVPGSKMPLQKVADRKKRQALIQYLKKAGAQPN